MQTAVLQKIMRTTCIEESLPSWFPVFRGWDDLEDVSLRTRRVAE
jgi:hypothetical protein